MATRAMAVQMLEGLNENSSNGEDSDGVYSDGGEGNLLQGFNMPFKTTPREVDSEVALGDVSGLSSAVSQSQSQTTTVHSSQQ